MSRDLRPAGEHLSQSAALRDAAFAVALLMPGILLGAAIASLATRRRTVWRSVGAAGCAFAGLALLHAGFWHPGQEWAAVLDHAFHTSAPSRGAGGIAGALVAESLFGPMWLMLLPTADTLGRLAEQTAPVRSKLRVRSQLMVHPSGAVRLGVDVVTGRPVDLPLHLFGTGAAVIGVSGSGKSSILTVLASAALGRSEAGPTDVADPWASGASVVVLDGKGPAIRRDIEGVARRHGIPFYVLDPDDPASLTYDPMQGTPAQISNKLLGGLVPSATSDAAVYKQLAQGALPPTIRALQQEGRCSLSELRKVFGDPGRLARLARESGDQDVQELVDQAAKDRLLSSALSGMAGRLRSLSAGHFRPLLEGEGTPYRWSLADEPSCTYWSLPSLEAVADAAIVCRQVLADIAQAVSRRQAQVQRGVVLRPLLVILDELTALSSADPEIEQRVIALLLQARAARVGVIVAGQTLPRDETARQAVVGTGCLITTRLTATDAERMAAEFGTENMVTLTHQVEDGRLSGAGTATVGHAYRVNPQELRSSRVGRAIVFTPPGEPVRIDVQRDEQPLPGCAARLAEDFRDAFGNRRR